MLILFLISFFVLTEIKPAQSILPDSINVYCVKENWHTGLMFEVSEFTIEQLPLLKLYADYQYVDIGWGDEDFYQAEDFNLYYAAKAILIPTPTVIRIDGYRFPMEEVIKWREFAILFRLPRDSFIKFITFIKNSLKYDDTGNYIISKKVEGQPIIFFKSKDKYHMFRTCNTWAAQAIKAAGFKINTFCLLTARQFYKRLSEHGKILKIFE
ncbi:MAG: putative outer membrane lipoprotein [Ignavibacteria bacterium]|nr:MAG: putative outer membrane lipoprotein [Ignavibacteria bacterium]KAF0161312.1 MAG: putative outer membrane lipoprotein [Ignavibacteria bacterium]